MKIEMGLMGEVQCFVGSYDDAGKPVIRTQTPVFKNLITDAGLDYMENPSSSQIMLYCHVGVGTTPPTFADKTLASWLAQTTQTYQSDTQTGSPVEDMQTADVVWGSNTRYYKFDPGQAVGNITEVGLSWFSGGTSQLFSRVLVKDAGGNPTAITVQPGEFLYIAYTVKCYLNAKDVPGTFEYNGEQIPYTVGLTNCTSSYTGGDLIGAFIAGVSLPRQSNYSARANHRMAEFGTGNSWGSDIAAARKRGHILNAGTPVTTYEPYVKGSYELIHVLTLQPNVGNASGGLGGIQFNNGFMNYRIQFLAPLKKTIDYTVTFRVSVKWGRYTP
ncbi:hypothetical protein [Stenotrophomonas phage vB_SmeS_BUCT700]|uniref:Uncharacterized protein n=1 Tax=Stenotrophomonas phage vB_SmeS_BUCT700 TaxID=2924895 RepID=A0AAE9GB36_9CAUD|nr:hypothetical protein [Stenotrophomonas phage vB_SmeS_BUCT700]UNY50267.1 hypothetical protein [Stenotrophomonas phage vB_SmeS_BUCT703]